jgi:hypothetical protein
MNREYGLVGQRSPGAGLENWARNQYAARRESRPQISGAHYTRLAEVLGPTTPLSQLLQFRPHELN